MVDNLEIGTHLGGKNSANLEYDKFLSGFRFKSSIFFLNGFSAREQICSICIPSGTHSHRFLCMLSENKSGKIQMSFLCKREKLLDLILMDPL